MAIYFKRCTPCEAEIAAYLEKRRTAHWLDDIQRGASRLCDLFDTEAMEIERIRRRHDRYAAHDMGEVPWGGWTFQPADMI